ncbi:fatty acid cis/trans isomerase [Paraglaciecola arctica]|uniref:fatty acid cis/trans isomerase n=1 Tax=Paraglaciecola arctica TaxID=1128911 RepID=UPI001C0794E5|nr:fatty acid cis/trans isomerase [Paraglaciecola arctica]MBU3004545.1 fatty acid cis/trans isomerase [Paraglaciecola arctica]
MNSRLLAVILALVSVAAIIIATQSFMTESDTVIVVPQNNLHTNYTDDVRPILEKRCVVCHACYDAPCQLKLGSIEGLTRGANKERVYDGERLLEANLSRLFEDGHSVDQWREKDFFPVVSDQAGTKKQNIENSLLAKMLLLKEANPLPTQKLLSKEFDLDLNRDYQCPTDQEFADYAQDYPLWGMPYGLPAIDNVAHQRLIDWVAHGATQPQPQPISSETQNLIDSWESFLNQNSKKAQLMSRYLFEHLFLVNLQFSDSENKQFFKLVRSNSQPGQPIKGIFTRRPFDDPKVPRVYYRMQPVLETIVHKSHMPITLNTARMERWSKWFLEADYTVDTLPSYQPEEASNPFISFAQIPVKTRYKYMLDEAQNTIMQFIKGPVCRGQLALNVINDHFWVFFASPDLDVVENNDEFMQQARQQISLPAEAQSNALPTSWLTYAAKEKQYLKAKSEFIEQHLKDKVEVTLDLLWDGSGSNGGDNSGKNDNATLTIFRHNDAATVVKGLVGKQPQTAWVLTYPLFERIHYLLVAGFDVYGNVGHQLNSRMYMDFLRMEGEFNFLSFLPKKNRQEVREKWYRGSVSEVEKYVYDANQTSVETDLNYKTEQPLIELYQKLQSHFTDVSNQQHHLERGSKHKSVLEPLQQINKVQGISAALIPQSSIVRVVDVENQNTHFYTLLRHNAYNNISHLFGEDDRRLPEEDTMTIAPGLMTSHPNAFFTVTTTELADFANGIEGLSSEQDYQALRKKYAVYRTSADFWEFADAMHQYFKQLNPLEFGVLDFNRLENR